MQTEPGARHERPLSDRELESIPTVPRNASGGLSRAAKDNYRARRGFARGGVDSFAGREKLMSEMGVDSVDTVDRSTKELVQKGFLEATGERRGRATKVYRLRRGETEVYRIVPQRTQLAVARPQVAAIREPQLAVRGPQVAAIREPQVAAYIEESVEKRALRALSSLPPEVAAAEPSPAEAGSAAAKQEPRKTGWRFQRTSQSGTFVRDPEGTDRPPRGYFDPIDRPPQRETVPDDGPLDSRRPETLEERQSEPAYLEAARWFHRLSLDDHRPTPERGVSANESYFVDEAEQLLGYYRAKRDACLSETRA